MDDEYEDEEDQWEEGAEDILEKGEVLLYFLAVTNQLSFLWLQSAPASLTSWRLFQTTGQNLMCIQAQIIFWAGQSTATDPCGRTQTIYAEVKKSSAMLSASEHVLNVDENRNFRLVLDFTVLSDFSFIILSLRHACPLQLTVILLSCCHHMSDASHASPSYVWDGIP